MEMPHGYIRPPKSIATACALTAISMQSVTNSQFGGISCDQWDTAMAPYVGTATDREVYQACESLIFNLNTMHSRAGSNY